MCMYACAVCVDIYTILRDVHIVSHGILNYVFIAYVQCLALNLLLDFNLIELRKRSRYGFSNVRELDLDF